MEIDEIVGRMSDRLVPSVATGPDEHRQEECDDHVLAEEIAER